MGSGQLLVAVSIEDGGIRDRLIQFLESLCNSRNALDDWRFAKVLLERYPTLQNLAESLNAHFAEAPQRFAIVVSDRLVDGGEFDQRAKELIDPHFHHPLVLLAVSGDGGRVADIDRVVRGAADRRHLEDALQMLVGRLRYMAPPEQHDSISILVRRIDDEFELAQYYKLRHQVYSIMGYISEEKERVATKLEIDGCDVNAIHIGAFHQCDGYERLAGTARILLANATESKWAEWTRSLLTSDRRLRVLVRNESLPLGLPVFQSQQLNDHLRESYTDGLVCAELSRVIVANEYRGAGVSRQLVQKAIKESQLAHVDRLYLECLGLHESLYAKFGFQTIPGVRGQVINVGKSMIAMMLELSVSRSPDETAAVH